MPREAVHSAGPEFPDFRPSVGWDRGHEVQLGIQVNNSDLHLTDVLHQPGPLGAAVRAAFKAHSGQHAGALHDPAKVEAYDPFPGITDESVGAVVLDALRADRQYVERDGIWCNLDRRQINTTIQLLRKGRDAAYGKDA